jgi:hypothetical protein
MEIGRLLILIGVLCICAGAMLLLLPKGSNPFAWFGKLPGDIYYKNENSVVFIPLVSMLVVSAVFSVISLLAQKLGR